MHYKLGTAALLLLIFAFSVSACGGDDEPSPTAAGNATDSRFVAGMVPHHEGAIEMAKLAEARAKREEIKEMAADILASQQQEIDQMLELQSELPQNAGTMMSAEAVSAMARETEALAISSDFDREFIVDMIPHHEGAITMARRLQVDGQSSELRELSRAIIGAQTKEIAQMRAWYEEWYGEPAPASKDGGHGGH